MSKKKRLTFFLILILLSNCSFDTKTGIWDGTEEEKEKISELEKEQRKIIDTYKVYSSENIYSKEIFLARDIILSKPKNLSRLFCPSYISFQYIFLPIYPFIFFRWSL